MNIVINICLILEIVSNLNGLATKRPSSWIHTVQIIWHDLKWLLMDQNKSTQNPSNMWMLDKLAHWNELQNYTNVFWKHSIKRYIPIGQYLNQVHWILCKLNEGLKFSSISAVEVWQCSSRWKFNAWGFLLTDSVAQCCCRLIVIGIYLFACDIFHVCLHFFPQAYAFFIWFGDMPAI